MEESPEEKYLGDMVHTDGLAASILSTINKRLGALIGKIDIIMNLAKIPELWEYAIVCARALFMNRKW